MYQFADLDQYLKSVGKEDIRLSIKKDLDELMASRREIRNLTKNKEKA
jgi:hypothetical protein